MSLLGRKRAPFAPPDARLERALTETTRIERRWRTASIVMCAFVIAVCLFGDLGAIGLVGPDEPRYVWIARAMAETGDWVTPRLYGQPWFEKPVLYYWAAAVGFRLHLPAESAARLPSALAALAAAIAIGCLGWKHYGRENDSEFSPALLALLIFSTSVAAIGFARSASPDMLFSASITLAMASAAFFLGRAGVLRVVRETPGETKREAWLLILFGAFLGLGVLAKGPAAVILAGGAIGLWAFTTGQWRSAFRLAHPRAIAAFGVVALPWYVLCALRNPDFLHVFLFEHNVERYLTPMFQHKQPFWFFGPITLLSLVPWTALLWPIAQEGMRLWREKKWYSSPGLFFACWAVFPIAFFSLSQSKLPGYILPAIPPLVLICSIGLVRAYEKSSAMATTLSAGISATCAIVAIAAFFFIRRFDWAAVTTQDGAPMVSWLVYGVLAMTLALASASVIAALHRKLLVAVGLCAIWSALAVEAANIGILPLLDSFYSARPHAAFLSNDRHPDRIFTYRLSRSWNYGLAFYFRRELPEWSASDPQPAFVLTTAKGAKEIESLGRIGGSLDERYAGIKYVPVTAAPITR